MVKDFLQLLVPLLVGAGLAYFAEKHRDDKQYRRERVRDQQQYQRELEKDEQRYQRERKHSQSQWRREKAFNLLIALNELDQLVSEYGRARGDILMLTGEWPGPSSTDLSALAEKIDHLTTLCRSLASLIPDSDLVHHIDRLMIDKGLLMLASSEEKQAQHSVHTSILSVSRELAVYARSL